MQLLSPFKILSFHIIELILDYVALSSRMRFDGVSEDSEEYVKLLIPLTACSSFISPVFARLYRIYEMQLISGSDKYQTTPSWLQTRLRDAGLSAHLYAKELDISVGVLDVCSGAAVDVLACEPYINCTFPKVRSIKFTSMPPSALEWRSYSTTTSPDTESIISAFVQRVKQIAPMTKKITISIGFRPFVEAQFPVQLFSRIVAQLSQHVAHIDYELYAKPVIIDQQLTELCSLVFSSTGFNDSGEQIFQLARRNASTLQVLDIFLATMIDVAGLIQNSDGSYVQYPCLHTLELCDSRDVGEKPRLVFPGAVPFPSLRHLNMEFVNPFGDDTAFRGNAATLESLNILPNLVMVRIL
ncbi:hypothetical protein H4R27_004759 [Coemansia aciculifera]|nr:hypothetical protein H4R27_004759 [Coemansia aciculifera]